MLFLINEIVVGVKIKIEESFFVWKVSYMLWFRRIIKIFVWIYMYKYYRKLCRFFKVYGVGEIVF